ncbi:MAG: hypothetical protein KH989_09975, partial [Kocuria rhizophila]|nr:hypothetical protein [Kocuria rhizophila]
MPASRRVASTGGPRGCTAMGQRIATRTSLVIAHAMITRRREQGQQMADVTINADEIRSALNDFAAS